MNTYRISFVGHREITDFLNVEKVLKNIIATILKSDDFIEFYIGNNGDFDRMVTSVIRHLRKTLGAHNSELILVLPYTNCNTRAFELQYDSVIIPDALHKIHPKRAITERNFWMIRNSDLLICYVTHKSGGAFTAFKYAKKRARIQVKNIADLKSE